MPKLQKRDGRLRLAPGVPKNTILAQETPEAAGQYTDCCCGYDYPPIVYVAFRRCKTGEKTGWYSSIGLFAAVWWLFPIGECVYSTYPPVWEPLPPDGQVAGNHAMVVGEIDCDWKVCTGEEPPPWDPFDPPDPPNPPPDQHPNPDCGDCGTPGPAAGCDLCTCKPVSKIRVAVGSTTNCTCVGPCSATTFQYARIADGDTADGIVDMDPVGTCEWIGTKAIHLMDGQVGDPPGVTCHNGPNVYSVSYHLKKLTKTLYVFSVYVNTMSPYDPRDYDPLDDTYNWRFFVGFATVQENTCMNVPTMANFMACQCESSATSDGRFGLAFGGIAVFDTCVA